MAAPKTDKTLEAEVADAIKTQYSRVDAVIGSAKLLDMETHTEGVDYTANGQLHARWVDRDKIQQRRAEGFRNPAEFSSRFKDITMGRLVLMLRPVTLKKQYDNLIESKNSHWEAETKKKMNAGKAQGLGEFNITPQRTLPG